jgi:hypothetical protein
MTPGQTTTIYANEREKLHPIGKFELLEKLNMGPGTKYSYWSARNKANGRVGRYLLINKNHEKKEN